MIRPIILFGDPVLRRQGDRVDCVTDEIRQLADDMLDTMREARGVGLAAPQVGASIQLAVVDVSHDEDCVSYLLVNGEERSLAEISPLVFINPKVEGGRETETDIEGCLSFPDLRAEIPRPAEIRAELRTLDGDTLVIETDGLLARAIQHEVDHLNGRLFIDRMSRAKKMSIQRVLREMQAEWDEKNRR